MILKIIAAPVLWAYLNEVRRHTLYTRIDADDRIARGRLSA
jgi:hypothetical protein